MESGTFSPFSDQFLTNAIPPKPAVNGFGVDLDIQFFFQQFLNGSSVPTFFTNPIFHGREGKHVMNTIFDIIPNFSWIAGMFFPLYPCLTMEFKVLNPPTKCADVDVQLGSNLFFKNPFFHLS